MNQNHHSTKVELIMNPEMIDHLSITRLSPLLWNSSITLNANLKMILLFMFIFCSIESHQRWCAFWDLLAIFDFGNLVKLNHQISSFFFLQYLKLPCSLSSPQFHNFIKIVTAKTLFIIKWCFNYLHIFLFWLGKLKISQKYVLSWKWIK